MRASHLRLRRSTGPRDAATRRRRAHTACAGLASLAAGLGCAAAPARAPEPSPPSPLPADAVRVRLVFGPEVDLDLYVTGPSQETVYFGNATSRDGGELDADSRCDAPAPRTESVLFPAASAGVYRVGVDFMVRCDPGVERAPYALVVEAPGREPEHLEREAEFGVFAPRVSEFRVGPPAPPAAP